MLSLRLQQSNDPKHRSNITKQFNVNNVPHLLAWPSNNPDANPIELKGFSAEEFENVKIIVRKNSVMFISYFLERWTNK